MKKIITALLLIVVLAGCNNPHDGKIILTENGKYYKLDWRIGGLYALQPIDTTYLRVKNFPKK